LLDGLFEQPVSGFPIVQGVWTVSFCFA